MFYFNTQEARRNKLICTGAYKNSPAVVSADRITRFSLVQARNFRQAKSHSSTVTCLRSHRDTARSSTRGTGVRRRTGSPDRRAGGSSARGSSGTRRRCRRPPKRRGRREPSTALPRRGRALRPHSAASRAAPPPPRLSSRQPAAAGARAEGLAVPRQATPGTPDASGPIRAVRGAPGRAVARARGKDAATPRPAAPRAGPPERLPAVGNAARVSARRALATPPLGAGGRCACAERERERGRELGRGGLTPPGVAGGSRLACRPGGGAAAAACGPSLPTRRPGWFQPSGRRSRSAGGLRGAGRSAGEAEVRRPAPPRCLLPARRFPEDLRLVPCRRGSGAAGAPVCAHVSGTAGCPQPGRSAPEALTWGHVCSWAIPAML